MSDQFRVQYETGFTVVPNEAMRDERLTIAARGFLGLIMSMSDRWVFRRNDLMKRCGVGRDKYRSMVRELEETGYLTVKAKQGADGRFLGTTWCICPNPSPQSDVTEGLKSRPPVTEGLKNPLAVEPAGGQIHPLKKEQLSKEEKEEKLSVAAPQNDFLFKEFWEAHPYRRNAALTRERFEAAIDNGIDPALIVAAAHLYAEERSGQDDTYTIRSDNWLRDQAWSDVRQPAARPKQSEIDAFSAKTIKKGNPALVSMMSDARARDLVAKNLVTLAECAAVGLKL